MQRLCILIFTLISLLFSVHTWTKNLYISDKIYVPVRSGQGNQYEILHRGLPTGTVVELVEKDEDWTKITTARGVTGWVRNQYLEEEPPASLQLESANKKIVAMESELKSLRSENSALKNDYAATKEQLTKTEQEINNIKTISASAIKSHERLQSLTKEMQLLQTENDVLKAENENLKRDERTTFFIYGVLTLLLGILIAIIIPRLRSRRRNGGWIN